MLSQPVPRIMQPSPSVIRRISRSQMQLGRPIALNVEVLNCPMCTLVVNDNDKALCCDLCSAWYHANCLLISEDEYNSMSGTPEKWFCDHCSSMRANKIRWGSFDGEDNISREINLAYQEIITWRKNLFTLPRGKSGTDFIKELTRLLYLFVDKTKWENIALSLVHIFIPLMLQKPSKKSKARDHTKYLMSRLEKWKQGNLQYLLAEGKEIQKRLRKNKSKKLESKQKSFLRLMSARKVGQVTKLINNNDMVVGVHSISDDIKEALAKKHPKAEKLFPEVLLQIDKPLPNPVIYENITAESIQRASKNLQGSGGPTLVDADAWKLFLCSRAYGKHPFHLAEAVAGLAKRLCSELIHPDNVQELTAGRLIPLDKGAVKEGNPGVRPIGIGETLRRIVGRTVMGVFKSDIQSAAGCLQTCTGLRSGIEAAIHATNEAWNLQST